MKRTAGANQTEAHDGTKAAARREELFSAAMLESLPGIAYCYEEQGRFRRWNQNFVTVSGYTPEEIARLHPLDFFTGADRLLVQDRINEVFATGESFVEATFISKDGRATPYFFTGKRVIFDGVPCAVGMGIDVTERKRAENALVASERRLREMLENIELLALTLDTQGVVTFCNDHLLRVTGWTREEIVGANWFARFIPDSDPATPKLFFEHMGTGRVPLHHENPIKTKTGAEREIAWNNTVLRDAAGNTVGMASIGEDVTDRRRADRALRASEERFRQVVENIEEVFWMTDGATGRILYISPGCKSIWGRTAESLLASPRAWEESVHEGDRDRVARAKMNQTADDETYRIVQPDGTVRWVRARLFPIRNEVGIVQRFVGVADDVTERKLLQEQFLRAQRLESIGMLAAGIAHDLNNVLAPIGLAAPLLRDKATTPSDRRLLETVTKCVERGAGLVRQILGFAHGVGGEPRPVQLRHLLRDITAVAETFPKSIQLAEDVARDLWPVVGNPTQIHQVLLNLCVNARDAMPSGGTLTLRAENCMLDAKAVRALKTRLPGKGAKAGAWVILHVQDSGTGIPPEVAARMWEPFFTTKSADKGTGLGLSTVRGIVESHHGFITLQTEVGAGTTFRVYLPAAESAATRNTNPIFPLVGRGNGELILVVDDEPSLRHNASEILTNAGYRVAAAANGAEGATLFAERAVEFALVITDLDMPVLSGIGLAGIIRESRPELKVLAMSGSSSRHSSADPAYFAAGFIAKPFAAEMLLDYVERLLRGEPVPTHSLTPWPRS